MAESYRIWVKSDMEGMLEMIRKRSRPMIFYSGLAKRAYGEAFVTTVWFTLAKCFKRSACSGRGCC